MKWQLLLFIIIVSCSINVYGVPSGLYENEVGQGFRIRRATDTFSDPCNFTALSKPDFSAPGRRISEEKCFDYIWDIKKREDLAKKSAACFNWWRQKSGPNKPHFAIGGRITTPGEFPHMGAVGWRARNGTWIFKCGSSLISPNFLLTAGHCSEVSSRDDSVANTKPEIVRLGDKNIADVYANDMVPQDAEIKRIINHPNYNPPKKYFDIAIIEITAAVEFTRYIQPACLWTKYDTSELGQKATLTGWGVVETAGRTTSPELQAAVVDIIDSNQCDRLLHNYCTRLWCGLESHQLCSGKLVGGVDACQGDSGGPLQVKIPLPTSNQGSMHYLIGVISFGVGCALPNLPGIYTRVSSFTDWIEDVVWRGL